MAWNSEMVASTGNMPYHTCRISPSYDGITDYDIKYSSETEVQINVFGTPKKMLFYLGSTLVALGNSEEQQNKYEAFFNSCLLLNTDTSIAGEANYKTILSIDMGGFYFVCSTHYESNNLYLRYDFVKDLQSEYTLTYFADTSKCIEWGNTYYQPQDKLVKYAIYSFNALNDNGENVQGFGIIRKSYAYDGTYTFDSVFAGNVTKNLWNIIDANPEIIEISDEYGKESTSGGYGGGSFDDSSDAFGLPSLPSLGVSEAGFVNVYKPTAGQLVGFADELFPDFEMPTPSTKEGLEGIVENLNNVSSVIGFFADSYLNKGLIDYVIDCHIIPVAPTTTNNIGIKVGYKTFEYNPSKVTSDYVEFDCGTLEIAEYYQNFLDYEGTRCKMYCPFIGFVDIKPEWFQSGSLRLVYHFNIIDGSCIAFVIATSSKSKLKNTVVATFGGNCCVHMPITGLNYSSMISGILGGASKVLSGQIARGAEQGALARPSLEQSNGYNAGMSFMCYRRPYLLIERPVASFSKNYPSEQGLPLNVTKKLSSVTGFTTCDNVNLDGFSCTDEEKNMIVNALKEGIIL